MARIFQVVRGWLGLTNHTDVTYVSSQILKFLYHGEMHGYLNDAHILACVERLKTKKSLDNIIEEAATSFFVLHTVPTQDPEAQLTRIREQILVYHQGKKGALKPSLLMGLFGKKFPSAAPTFGAVYVELAKRELAKRKVEKFLMYLNKAQASTTILS